MSSPDQPLVQRPWPRRDSGDGPWSGRSALVLDPDLVAARALATTLSRLGCSAQARRGGDDADTPLVATTWDMLIAAPHAIDGRLREQLERLDYRPGILMLEDRGWEPTLERHRDLVDGTVPLPATEDALRLAIGRSLERRDLAEENRQLRDRLAARFALGSIVTRDAALRAVLETVETVADTRANVLILGETGTGKTMLAHALHEHSTRQGGPFVVVNCGALPGSLLESELFGHAKGSFTGAIKDKVGRFEKADGGTLFLDEINSATLDLQVKLLRVIQERAFERVGESNTRRVDVRIVTASNADLVQEIDAGRFREDLYWRLNVVTLKLPALRDRLGDLALLIEHFVARHAAEYDKLVDRVHPDCLTLLAAQRWPGNVRQLENVLERAVLLCQGRELIPADLGPEILAATPAAGIEGLEASLALGLRNLERLPSLKDALEGPERQIIRRALELCRGSRQETAEMLQINRTTLFNKMRKYELMDLTFQAQDR
ncbi:MAG: sigma-54-dependent Fis family transcriptional regulator [bacterium]|nr:sigma-54-dependent Fis family transcriptional regulator [bacterium]